MSGATISIHALLAESDNRIIPRGQLPATFLSTLSLRRATWCVPPWWVLVFDFYPRSPCGERPCILTISICTALFLSTLSLRRATLPTDGLFFLGRRKHFYPRSPCGERPPQPPQGKSSIKFLSTLSLRRATGIMVFCGPQGSDFYPRSPCGERRPKSGQSLRK